MIGKISKSNSPYSTIKYIGFKDGAKILDTNMAGKNPAQLANEFEYFSNKNQRMQKPVFHLSINPHPLDRYLTESEYIDIASDIRLELGFDDCIHQYLLALHTDAKLKDTDEIRPHLHLIVNRVDFDGKCKNDYLDYINIQKACRKVELKYGLITQPHSWEIEEKKGPPSRELETKFIQNAINTAASDKPEMPTFISRLLSQNVGVQCRITRTGKLQGISYSYSDKVFKGRQIGSDYTHIGIQQKLGVVHKPSHKKEISDLIKTYQVGFDSPNPDSSFDDVNSSTTSLIVDNSSQQPIVKETPAQQPNEQEQQQYARAISQRQNAERIASAVRLLWQVQVKPPNQKLEGNFYNLELVNNSIIQVRRKSGEEIAQIPLSAEVQPLGIALGDQDLHNWSQVQQILERHLNPPQSKPQKDKDLEL